MPEQHPLLTAGLFVRVRLHYGLQRVRPDIEVQSDKVEMASLATPASPDNKQPTASAPATVPVSLTPPAKP